MENKNPVAHVWDLILKKKVASKALLASYLNGWKLQWFFEYSIVFIFLVRMGAYLIISHIYQSNLERNQILTIGQRAWIQS